MVICYSNTDSKRRAYVHALLRSGNPVDVPLRRKIAYAFRCSLQTVYYDIVAYYADTEDWAYHSWLRRRWAVQRGHARKYRAHDTLTFEELEDVSEKANGVCHYCQVHFGRSALTVDHVVPLVRGGTNTADNIVMACSACNMSKNDRQLPRRKPCQTRVQNN